MEDSLEYLRNPYTFEITTSDAVKVSARRQLAGLSIEVLEHMRDELIECGIRSWAAYKGLTNEGK